MLPRALESFLRPARKIRRIRCISLLLALTLWTAAPPLARAISIPGYTSAANDRFSSGYNVNPVTNPIPNADPLFVGHGCDWSGVGWSNSDLTKSFGMISPQHFLVATHYGGAASIEFLGANGQLYVATQQSVVGTGLGPGDVGDVSLGTLTSAVPASTQVTYYPILDLVPSLSGSNYTSYVGQSLLMYGKIGRVASNTTNEVGISGIGYCITESATLASYEGGDSGSPIFIPWTDPNSTQRLTLLGAAWAVDNLSAPTTNFESFIAESGVAKQLNLMMAAQGYALRWVGNASATWNGSSSNSFNRTSNWTPRQIPSDAYAAFDGSTSQRTLSLAGNQNLRGLIFKNVTGANGFTFQAGYTLTVGRGGILNYDADSPQTFACNLVLGDPQWWDGGAGGLIVAGGINNNGNLLIIDGAGNTLLGGAVTGTGGLAKEGAGTLTLSGSSGFSGPLFVHNGTVNLTGSATAIGSITVAAGSALAGNGLLAPSGTNNVTVNGTLSPGDSLTPATLRFGFASGELIFTDTASLVFKAGDSSDLVQLSNGQVILGGTLQIVQGPGFSYSGSYKLFSGLTTAPAGTFSTVTGLAAGFNPSYNFNAGDYSVSFVPTLYSAWQQAHFTAAEIASGQADDQADPDADGIPNLVEYALGLDPKLPSPGRLPVPDASGTYLTLTVTKNPNATDVTYSVEVTGDLTASDWNSAGTTVLVDNANTLVVRDNTAIADSNRRFMRLRVTRQ